MPLGRGGSRLRADGGAGMKVLVACEFSGIVREAFKAKGHDAWSCDLLPTEIPGQHIQGDVLEILNDGWDMMIAHPPCTCLTVSQNKWLKDQPERKSGALVGRARRLARLDTLRFFLDLYDADIKYIAIENPIGCVSSVFRKPDQVIQPWMFGHGETKATCLWLENLPLLQPTHRKNDFFCEQEPEARVQRLHLLPKTKDRWKERSRTYQGIANAMAAQWNFD